MLPHGRCQLAAALSFYYDCATMSISWNEIRQRAVKFSREWEGISRERADAQTFWNEFFEVFGIRRRTVACVEEPVKTVKGP